MTLFQTVEAQPYFRPTRKRQMNRMRDFIEFMKYMDEKNNSKKPEEKKPDQNGPKPYMFSLPGAILLALVTGPVVSWLYVKAVAMFLMSVQEAVPHLLK